MMDPRDRGRRILAVIFLASLAFTFIFLGLFLIGETTWKMDCERSSGIVDCVITTRSLGFFASRQTVSNLIRAVQVKDCQADSCSYHIELLTNSGWQTYFLDSFSNESKAKDVDRINAYLVDFRRQALHTRVIYWRWFIPFAAGILIGGAGLVFALFLGLSLRRTIHEWQPAILEKKKNGASPLDRTYAKIGFDPAPAGLRVEQDASMICIHYRYPVRKGWISLLLGVVFMGLGWSRPVYFWIRPQAFLHQPQTLLCPAGDKLGSDRETCHQRNG